MPRPPLQYFAVTFRKEDPFEQVPGPNAGNSAQLVNVCQDGDGSTQTCRRDQGLNFTVSAKLRVDMKGRLPDRLPFGSSLLLLFDVKDDYTQMEVDSEGEDAPKVYLEMYDSEDASEYLHRELAGPIPNATADEKGFKVEWHIDPNANYSKLVLALRMQLQEGVVNDLLTGDGEAWRHHVRVGGQVRGNIISSSAFNVSLLDEIKSSEMELTPDIDHNTTAETIGSAITIWQGFQSVIIESFTIWERHCLGEQAGSTAFLGVFTVSCDNLPLKYVLLTARIMYRKSTSSSWRPLEGLQDLAVATNKTGAYQVSWTLKLEDTYSGYYKAQLFRQVDLLKFYDSQEEKEKKRIDIEAQARSRGLPVIGGPTALEKEELHPFLEIVFQHQSGSVLRDYLGSWRKPFAMLAGVCLLLSIDIVVYRWICRWKPRRLRSKGEAKQKVKHRRNRRRHRESQSPNRVGQNSVMPAVGSPTKTAESDEYLGDQEGYMYQAPQTPRSHTSHMSATSRESRDSEENRDPSVDADADTWADAETDELNE